MSIIHPSEFPIQRPDISKGWARICAFAWHSESKQENVLQKLRQNPKETIIQIASGEYDADALTASFAQAIADMAEEGMAPYSGYLPIPEPSIEQLKEYKVDEMAIMFSAGITGLMKFNQQPKLWAKVFLAAWNDNDLLIKIRQDPLQNLSNLLGSDFQQLQNSKYGILPLPDLPSDLSDLSLEQIHSIGDQWNNPMGIFPIACTV